MHKKIILLLTLLLPWTLAAQEEIRTAAGDTVMRKVRKIERRDLFNGRPQLYLENSGIEALPTKVPFSYVKSIRFEDGCEVFFDNDGLVFERTRNPRKLTAQNATLYLEGVYPLDKTEMQMLLGPEVYKNQIQPYRTLYNAGEIVSYGGAVLCLPWLATKVMEWATPADKRPTSPSGNIRTSAFNALAIAGVACMATGITLCIVGRNGCRRFAVSFTGDGINLSHQF